MEIAAFADTNWIVAGYFRELDPRRTAIVDRFSGRFDVPWLISAVVMLECENTFRYLRSEDHPPEWTSLQDDIGSRIALSIESWDTISAKAKELFKRFSHKGRIGTMDMMILASALKCEATHFLSFDTNSNLRALAALLKLKVFPELTVQDKARMAAFR